MSDYKHTPDRPITWTLASEPRVKQMPSLEELWAEWRKDKTWEASGGGVSTERVNNHFEQELLKHEQ